MRNWERPMVTVDTFAANEFISSCGDKNTVYKFECNAGDLNLNSYPYYVYVDYTPNDGIDNYRFRSTYHACGATHEAPTNDAFYRGYMIDGRKNKWEAGYKTDVIVWTDHNRNTHCTTKLDMSTWETHKS